MTADLDIETQRRIELGYLRQAYVDRIVQQKVDRNPNVDNAQIEKWEKDCYLRWRETYPALASMFPSVLPGGWTYDGRGWVES